MTGNGVSILKQIIDEVVSANSDLEEILRRCKVLATQLGSETLENWLIWESKGYPEGVELPDYRIWPMIVKGNFAGLGRLLSNWTIPPALLPLDEKNGLEMRCGDSLSTIAHTLAEADSQMISIDLGNLSLLLGSDVLEGMSCVSAWGEFHKSRLAEVLNAVRNRLLDFALALWKELPQNIRESDGPIKLPENRVTQVINTTVFSGTANVVGVAKDSHLSFHIQTGSFDDLAKVLRDRGIAEEDLATLQAGLREDPELSKGGTFGPRVAQWIGNMLAKAAAGTWKIAVSAASILLIEAIKTYYNSGH